MYSIHIYKSLYGYVYMQICIYTVHLKCMYIKYILNIYMQICRGYIRNTYHARAHIDTVYIYVKTTYQNAIHTVCTHIVFSKHLSRQCNWQNSVYGYICINICVHDIFKKKINLYVANAHRQILSSDTYVYIYVLLKAYIFTCIYSYVIFFLNIYVYIYVSFLRYICLHICLSIFNTPITPEHIVVFCVQRHRLTNIYNTLTTHELTHITPEHIVVFCVQRNAHIVVLRVQIQGGENPQDA